MQNLTKYRHRRCIISNKLFNTVFKYDARNYILFNKRSPSSTNTKHINRLLIPVSYHAYQEIHKQFSTLYSLYLQKGFNQLKPLPSLPNIRNFSTTSPRNNAEKDPTKGSSGNSDKDPKKDDEKEKLIYMYKMLTGFFFFGLLFVGLLKLFEDEPTTEHAVVSWNEFVHQMLEKGEVEEIIVVPSVGRAIVVLHDGAIIKGKRTSYKRFYVNLPDLENFEERIRDIEQKLGINIGEGVQIIYERHSEMVATSLAILVYAAIALFVLLRLKGGISLKMGPLDFISQLSKAKFTLVEPLTGKGVKFEDVAGLKEAKIEVMEFVDYLKHPERYKTLGAKVPKGALLLGPPGCGKTLLAKAVATESNVPFLSMNGSEFIEMLGGLGAARVRDLFKEAKKRAPSIIYIDEIDAIGKKRSEHGIEFSNSESERTLNQLLVEMDGMTTHEDIIILASTNRAEVLDKALLRPGRFDRHILIDLPTLDERKQIFESHLKVLSLEGKPEKYSGYLAYLTPGFSGADIANVCNESALHAARDKKKKVDGSDLLYAVDRTIGGITKKSNTLTPSVKKVVAYHEAGHAIVGWLLEHTSALLKVTIVPRTNMSLGFAQYSEMDQKLHTKEELFENICMMLGGRVAESITFNKISTGAENDLKKVTKTAYYKVQQFGMSPTIGLLSFDEESTSTRTKKPYSKKLANVMDAEVRRIIAQAYKATEKLLMDNSDKLTMLAEALLEKETLTYEDVEKLIGPPPFGKKRLVEPAEFEMPVVNENDARTPEPTPP